ncbi:MAG: NAD-dependent epimerase/dehydratase family protein [Lachnospiraceae bacterium]|jgi:UDP-glucose 4-epimerase|nr:NAD-dependent epimerase/dehydratase family protein [Lachnospiraceae bacterium]
MKKVLVVGENSYIGQAFAAFAHDKYEVKMVSSRNEAWKNTSFAGYDCVLHCAGIAHASRNPQMEALYYQVNCDLAVAVAGQAKAEGARQFILLSSILVYGSQHSEIDDDTVPKPDDFYGLSKLKAEQELAKLASDDFQLCLVRPPMVYGQGCKGNFPRLAKLAKRIPFFPDYPNKRSMIYIENLCCFLDNIIDKGNGGIYKPQNKEYVNTSELVKCMAACYGRRMRTTKFFNPCIRLLAKRMTVLGKLFGDLYYSRQGDEDSYNVVDFADSIKKTIM